MKGGVKQEYFDYNFVSTRSQPGDLAVTHNSVVQRLPGDEVNGMNSQHMPPYSVFVENDEINGGGSNSVA